MIKPWDSSGKFVPTERQIKSNTKQFNDFSLFLGVMDVTHQNLGGFTPYIKGISRIFLHKAPIMMDVQFPDETLQFKQYVESGFKEVTGIGDISVDFASFEGGYNAQQFNVPSAARDDTDTLTISVYELTGSPIVRYLEMWVSGVRDLATRVAHYHGALERENGAIEYSDSNHMAEWIYTSYDPTAKTPEYVCHHAFSFPRGVPKSHFDYDGSNDGVTLSMNFTTKKYESPAINDIGWWYTLNSTVDWNYLDFDPEKNNTGAIGDAKVQNFTYDYGSDGERHDLG